MQQRCRSPTGTEPSDEGSYKPGMRHGVYIRSLDTRMSVDVLASRIIRFVVSTGLGTEDVTKLTIYRDRGTALLGLASASAEQFFVKEVSSTCIGNRGNPLCIPTIDSQSDSLPNILPASSNKLASEMIHELSIGTRDRLPAHQDIHQTCTTNNRSDTLKNDPLLHTDSEDDAPPHPPPPPRSSSSSSSSISTAATYLPASSSSSSSFSSSSATYVTASSSSSTINNHSQNGTSSSKPSTGIFNFGAGAGSGSRDQQNYLNQRPVKVDAATSTPRVAPCSCPETVFYHRLQTVGTETRHAEFKRGGVVNDQLKFVMLVGRYMCGFLNSGGGVLYLGVDDDGRVLGVETTPQSEAALEADVQEAFSHIQPGVDSGEFTVNFAKVMDADSSAGGPGRGSSTVVPDVKVLEICVQPRPPPPQGTLYSFRHTVYVRRDGSLQTMVAHAQTTVKQSDDINNSDGL